MRNTRLSALRRRVLLFVSEVCTKVMPTEQPAKENPVSSLAKRDPNDLFYINLPMDRALLAFTHAAILLEDAGWTPSDDREDNREKILDVLGRGAFACSLPLDSDPMVVNHEDADGIYLWLQEAVFGGPAY